MSVPCHEELQAALSIASFEATATATFRQNLQAQLSKLLQQCQIHCDDNDADTHMINHYNPQHLTSYLLKGLEWNEHCKYHDERMYTTSSTVLSDLRTTPLIELVMLLLDPRVIPLALSSSILSVLVQVFLTFYPVATNKRETKRRKKKLDKGDTRAPAGPYVCSRWTPSQLLLLESIKRLMMARQCRDDLPSIITVAYKSTVDQQQGRPSLEASQSLLSLTKYCVTGLERVGRKGYCPSSSLFPCILNLFKTIIDPQNQLVGAAQSEGTSCCLSCGKYIDPLLLSSLSKGRKRKRMDMVALHEATEHALTHRQRTATNHLSQPLVALKAIMEADDDAIGSCPYCQATITSREFLGATSLNAKAWCQLRDKCIHSMIAFFQSTKQLSKHRAFGLLRETLLVVAASCDDKNPVLRLLVLQMAHTAGRDGYGFLILTLWNLTFQRNNPKYLAWYAEIIVESSFCDDREACWDALQPLVNSIESRYLLQEKDCSTTKANANMEDNNDFPNKVLLPCLGYILSRRKKLFQTVQDSIHSDFNLLIQRLSRSCHDITLWVNEKPMDGTVFEADMPLFKLLFGLGIVSKASAQPDKESMNTEERQSSSHSLPQWSDPRPMELRWALERTQWYPEPNSVTAAQRGNYRIEAKLLSDLDHDARLMRASKLISPSIALFRYLGDDLLRQVFSFLGYKKLVKLRTVCKSWRDLSDENRFWEPLYGARFTMLHDGSTIAENTWKDRFIEKWVMQREIRFKCSYNERAKTAFKYRCCRYIGCQQVIKNSAELKNHNAWHSERTITNNAMREKAQMERAEQERSQGGSLNRQPTQALVAMGGPVTEESNDGNKKQAPVEADLVANNGASREADALNKNTTQALDKVGDLGTVELNAGNKKIPAVEADDGKSEAQKLFEAEKKYPLKKLMAMAYGLTCAVDEERILGLNGKEPYLSCDRPKQYDPTLDFLKQEVIRRGKQYMKQAREGGDTKYKLPAVAKLRKKEALIWLLAHPNLNAHDNAFLRDEEMKLRQQLEKAADKKQKATDRFLSKSWNRVEPNPDNVLPDNALSDGAAVPESGILLPASEIRDEPSDCAAVKLEPGYIL